MEGSKWDEFEDVPVVVKRGQGLSEYLMRLSAAFDLFSGMSAEAMLMSKGQTD